MRMLVTVRLPHEPFNSLVREGKAGETLGRILEEIRPEAVYFTEIGGRRGLVAVVDVADPSRVPAIAEPFFLGLNAECELRVAMSAEDLKNAGLEEIGKRWS